MFSTPKDKAIQGKVRDKVFADERLLLILAMLVAFRFFSVYISIFSPNLSTLRSILRDSLSKLRRLGYFSDVQISTSEVAKMPDKIDIAFSIKETQTGSVSFSMSHSNNYGISFGAGIEEKNMYFTYYIFS